MDLKQSYRLLSRARAFNQVLIEHRKDTWGPLLTGYGSEAVGLGVALGLYADGILRDSVLYGDHRTQQSIAVAKDLIFQGSHSHVGEIFRNHFLRATSSSRGRDGNIHWGCFEHGIGDFAVSHMGAMAPVAVGHAMALRRRIWPKVLPSERPVAVVFFGEGAAQQGAVHEAMNFAAAQNAALSDAEMAPHLPFMDEIAKEQRVLRGAPVIFVINANNWSIATTARDEHGNSYLANRAFGYGRTMSADVDGDNLLDVIMQTRLAVTHAQNLISTLLICHTKRRTGHNEDENVAAYRSEEEIARDWDDEPLKRLRVFVADRENIPVADLEIIDKEERGAMASIAQSVLTEPRITLEEHHKDVSLFNDRPRNLYLSIGVSSDPAKGQKMRYKAAFNFVLRELLERHSDMLYFGEDVADVKVVDGKLVPGKGGVLEVTKGLSSTFGEHRVFNTPLSEEAITGAGIGLALGGEKPWNEIQFSPFFAEAFAQYVYVVGPNWYQKKMPMGFVQVHHFGVVHSGGSGEYHSDCTEKYFYPIQGIKIVFPADAYDVVGLLRSAYNDSNPVLIYMQIYAYGKSEFSAFVPEGYYDIPIGEAAVKREGTDCTVVTYGAACVRAALNEAEALTKDGISVEVIDLRSIVPLDMETVGESLRKTGRVIVMHEARRTGSVGESIIAKISQTPALLPYLRTPQIPLVAADDTPIPSAKELEWARLPFEQFETGEGEIILRSSKLASAIRELMKF